VITFPLRKEGEITNYENYADIHYECGVAELTLPPVEQFILQSKAKLLGATRVHVFSDGSMAMLIIYRNLCRPSDDFVCRYAIYDAGWNLRALLPCKRSDPPVSLTEYQMMMKKKEEHRKVPEVTIHNVADYVKVHKTAPSAQQVVTCRLLGFGPIIAFSDQSIGATVTYSNPLVPRPPKNSIIPFKSTSAERGFVLDQKCNELARYTYKPGNRLLSIKQYDYIKEQQEMEVRKELQKQEAEAAAAKGYDARNFSPLEVKLPPKPPKPKKDLGRIFSEARRHAFWEGQANVMSIYDSFNQRQN
jgi:hypothetical protein